MLGDRGLEFSGSADPTAHTGLSGFNGQFGLGQPFWLVIPSPALLLLLLVVVVVAVVVVVVVVFVRCFCRSFDARCPAFRLPFCRGTTMDRFSEAFVE